MGFRNCHGKLKMLPAPPTKGNPHRRTPLPCVFLNIHSARPTGRHESQDKVPTQSCMMCKRPLWLITRKGIILSFPEAYGASLIWQGLWGLPASGHGVWLHSECLVMTKWVRNIAVQQSRRLMEVLRVIRDSLQSRSLYHASGSTEGHCTWQT